MQDFSEHYGHWGLALLMVVIASWVLYRYVAPKRWREWSRAGIVQAFIIALYAEMYGFPLTIYVLTDLFGIDIPLSGWTGHLWATVFGYGAVGATIEMILGYVFLVAGIVLIVQGWREVYRASREKRLATGGVYSIMRHPQYTGLLLALFGEGVIHWPTVLTLSLYPLMVWLYVRLARKEEKEMVATFGEDYLAYQRRVPMFLPRWGELNRLFTVTNASTKKDITG